MKILCFISSPIHEAIYKCALYDYLEKFNIGIEIFKIYLFMAVVTNIVYLGSYVLFFQFIFNAVKKVDKIRNFHSFFAWCSINYEIVFQSKNHLNALTDFALTRISNGPHKHKCLEHYYPFRKSLLSMVYAFQF